MIYAKTGDFNTNLNEMKTINTVYQLTITYSNSTLL